MVKWEVEIKGSEGDWYLEVESTQGDGRFVDSPTFKTTYKAKAYWKKIAKLCNLKPEDYKYI